MKKSSPYEFAGIPKSGDSAAGASPVKHSSSSSSSSKRRPRSRSPPRPQQASASASSKKGEEAVWDKMVKRSSPAKKRDGGGGKVLHVSLSWEELFTEDDRKSNLRMGVKLLALLAFSPLFLAKACIDLISSLNQYFLDYLPGIVDATYTWLVLPLSRAAYRAARLASRALHACLLRPLLAVARWWWALLVPPVAAALRWLWGGLCAVPGWAWAQASALYLVLRHRLLPSVYRKLADDVWPWVNAKAVRPVWEAYLALFRWCYGTVHAHILQPLQSAARGLACYVAGRCRRGRDRAVDAANGAVGFVRDGFEVAALCVGMLVLGRSPEGGQ